MKIQFRLNGKTVQADIQADMLLIDLLRDMGCTSVKRGCETDNCGLCTVWMDKKPILSCSTLAVRANGRHLRTLEGLQKDAEEFGLFLAKEGGERGGDQGVSGRKPVPVQRVHVPAAGREEVSGI